MEQHVKVTVEEHSPMAVLHLEGALAQLEVYKFKAQLEKIIQAGTRYIIFNLERLTFIDSAGIGALVQIRAELNKGAGALALAAPTSPHVKSALTTSQFGKVIPTYTTLAEARHEFTEKHGLRDPTATQARQTEQQQIVENMRRVMERLDSIDARLTRLEGKS